MGELVSQDGGNEQGSQRAVTQSGSSRAKTLWEMKDAKERGDAHFDQTYATKLERGEEVRRMRTLRFRPTFGGK